MSDLARACHPKLSLSANLIPSTMWGKNVRAVVSIQVWQTLRWNLGATQDKPFMPLFRTADGFDRRRNAMCRGCGIKQEEMELHEVWEFDEVKRIQRLVDLITLCNKCHLVMHLGRAMKVGHGDIALAHLASVNGWTMSKAQQHAKGAMETWHRRSQFSYTLDFSFLYQWISPGHVHLDWLQRPKRWVGDQIDAIEWARGIVQANALILDSETTGLLKNPFAEVVELAVVTIRGRVIFEGRFKPRRKIPKRTTAIHGITDEDVKNEPSFAQMFPEIQKALNGRIVVAFNAAFDRGIIEKTCSKFSLPPPDCRWECAMLAYRAYMESGKYLRLPGGTHKALDDCRATVKLIKQIANGISIPNSHLR
jgi:DNA polymerase III subunit epsilon